MKHDEIKKIFVMVPNIDGSKDLILACLFEFLG